MHGRTQKAVGHIVGAPVTSPVSGRHHPVRFGRHCLAQLHPRWREVDLPDRRVFGQCRVDRLRACAARHGYPVPTGWQLHLIPPLPIRIHRHPQEFGELRLNSHLCLRYTPTRFFPAHGSLDDTCRRILLDQHYIP